LKSYKDERRPRIFRGDRTLLSLVIAHGTGAQGDIDGAGQDRFDASAAAEARGKAECDLRMLLLEGPGHLLHAAERATGAAYSDDDALVRVRVMQNARGTEDKHKQQREQ
jgi:hypothetical protein